MLEWQNAPNCGLPLVFMYEGMIYAKQMDGLFHKFEANADRIPKNSLVTITMAEAREIFASAKWIGSIITLTNNVNLKV